MIPLGRIVEGKGCRDAVHVAIAPVTAGMVLGPGNRVNIENGYAFQTNDTNYTGVVDPFLRVVLQKGDRFYVLMVPETITSIRHEWTHPSFDGDKSTSMAWLADFAKETYMSYDELLQAAHAWLDKGVYHIIDGYSTPDIVWNQNDEFWEHFQVATGRIVALDDRNPFISCAC